MNSIMNRIGTVFIPVSNIENARDWYCKLLGLPADGEVLFGHLYILPMEGTGIVLDSKIYHEDRLYETPAFHFNTTNIEAAFEFLQASGIELATGIEHNQWINFKDPDGNLLMVCRC
ncbi:hypothetical protein GCM10008018_56540 [Paenibacillus marchantiophytorum]|uniref:Glyoxalase/fosfomycin resistance/dioxygenase domain-containing protein n=1 Tax=Paenibacillus marchantiophytorum TaxID=1619310 RepID=A0ABQ1F8R0_9BACL|nr:VOC family protein [Paenibacillus marchantiophytorum]GGA03163.1 hypothetical protein GCM10008018_56540 [Paenibacillus marchantiophytorum]